MHEKKILPTILNYFRLIWGVNILRRTKSTLIKSVFGLSTNKKFLFCIIILPINKPLTCSALVLIEDVYQMCMHPFLNEIYVV